jgi:hypothetical protein
MSPLKLSIIKRTRNGKVSLWVDIPDAFHGNTSKWNIWDLDPEIAANRDVIMAIKRAFELGIRAQMAAYQQIDVKLLDVVREEEYDTRPSNT